MSARRGPDLPLWRVAVRHHRVGGRFDVGELHVVLPAVSADHARRVAIQHAHVAAEVPPLRSLAAESLPHATAEART